MRRCVEAFDKALREELLNRGLFTSLADARRKLAALRYDGNNVWPHSSLWNGTPTHISYRQNVLVTSGSAGAGAVLHAFNARHGWCGLLFCRSGTLALSSLLQGSYAPFEHYGFLRRATNSDLNASATVTRGEETAFLGSETMDLLSWLKASETLIRRARIIAE